MYSAGGSDAGEPNSERFDEEDKESHVLNAKGGAANSKQDSIAIMKKYNIKTA